MTSDRRTGLELAAGMLHGRSLDELRVALAPKPSADPLDHGGIPGGSLASREAVERRWSRIAMHRPQLPDSVRSELLDPRTASRLQDYGHNIEQLIGCVSMPLGIAGPLRVNGLHAQGSFLVPLATTEAALVASYSRGARLISEAGGCSALLLAEGVTRSPGFVFADVTAAGRFVLWVLEQQETFTAVAAATTRHGRLEATRLSVEGNHVYLLFDYSTGDAAGQNMVTIATRAICEHIQRCCPEPPLRWFLEVNLSGDKKASAQSFATVRGHKVTAEVRLPRALVRKRLHTTPELMAEFWRFGALGGVMSGCIGVQGHVANGLAALFIACGQDAACVAEAAVGVTRMELCDGDLYAAVTLPGLIVGTVGGGTGLPSQRACLELLGMAGGGKSRALAELCAGLVLAGELSITGALCSDEFSRAHQKLAR